VRLPEITDEDRAVAEEAFALRGKLPFDDRITAAAVAARDFITKHGGAS